MKRQALDNWIAPYAAPLQQGLTAQQVTQRQKAGLSNQVPGDLLPGNLRLVLRHCATFFNLIFLVLATFLMLAGSSIIKLSFLVVVIINAIIGCIQSIRARQAVEKLTLVAEQTLTVRRDGALVQVTSSRLVRDDLVLFSAGDQICADGILRQGQLLVNESLVTGEEEPVVKAVGDSLLSGSFVVAGSAMAQLTQVGAAAFANSLAREAKKDPRVKKSEMMAALDRLIRVMGIILIPVGGILFCHEYFALGRPLRVGVESMTAALVGMIPEGLYLLTSIALAVSSIRLARRQVLVRDMNCIESLARVDVLCLDKTGTITEPALEVEQVIPLEGDPTALLNAMAAALTPENETAKAISRAFSGKSDWRCKKYTPFTAQTRWTGWEFEEKGRFFLGAPEAIPGVEHEKVRSLTEPYTARGLRVLLAADGEGTPLALVLLASSIRPDAIKTFAYFKAQGVNIKVISGDDPRTVSAIAQRAGIENAENWVDASALTTDEEICAATGHTVFGRVNPAQKRSLIRALKAQGHTVAMTGDGVNDILAMKDADCAVAMAGGAQAASQVAQLVLLRGDFSAMPRIVNEGRRVIHNIQRAAALFLVKNIFSLGITLLTLLFGLPYPMEPQHMTIISGLTIGFPAFFLALEPNVQPVGGRFLPAVLKKALPGGVTDILVVLLLQILLPFLQLPSREISTLATVALATTGLLVLRRTAKPFRLRGAVWCAAAVGLVGCFTLLGGIFEFAFSAVSLTLLPVVMGVTVVVFWFFGKYLIANF